MILRQLKLSCLLIICSISVAFAGLTAKLDRQTIAMGESVNLSISTPEKVDGQPDLSVLNENFSIVGSSNNSQISVINGQQSRETEWIITLMPKNVGTITIPVIKIGAQSTNKLQLVVKPASQLPGDSRLFLQAQVSPKPAYVGAQVNYTTKLFYRIDRLSGALLDPAIPGAQVLGSDSNYQVTQKGKVYNVVERHYIFFPNQAGEMTIPGIVFSGQEPVVQRSGNSIEQLFRLTAGKPLTASAPSLTLDVKPRPATISAADWLPANKVSVKQFWSGNADKLHVGDPITRTIEIRAVGQLANKIPEIQVADSNDVNYYLSQPKINTVTDGNNVIGTRTEKIAYIPTKAGSVTLPAMTFQWFNVKTGKPEKQVLPAIHLKVLPAAAVTNANSASGQNTVDNQATALQPLTPSDHSVTEHNSKWIWLLVIILLLAWLATIVAWRISKRRLNKSVSSSAMQSSTSIKQARQAVRAACNDNDARQLANVVLQWAQYYWQDTKIRNLGDIAQRDIHPNFSKAINELANVLYKHNETLCAGHNFWLSFVENEKYQPKNTQPDKDDLPPLHPN